METIKLDLIPGKKMPSLHASQYDDGRDYHIDLTENRVPYTLDGTETISLTVRKCDNTLVTMDVANTFADKSYIEFRTTEQMNACAGFNYGEIVLEENGTRIGSLNFYLQVEGAPDEGGVSQSEINNLARQVEELVDEEMGDYLLKTEAEETYATITDLETLSGVVDTKASASDLETLAGVVDTKASKTYVDSVADTKADKSTTYTKTQVDNKLSEKANADDVYQKTETYSKTETDNLVSPKADKTYVDTQLQTKANASDVYTKTETDNKISALIDDTQALENKAWSGKKTFDEIVNILPTGNASGSIANFNTSLALPLEIEAEFGADVGGVSAVNVVHTKKNLAHFVNSGSSSSNVVSYTANKSEFTINSTLSSSYGFRFGDDAKILLKKGTYYLSSNITNQPNNAGVFVYNVDTTTILARARAEQGQSFTLSSDAFISIGVSLSISTVTGTFAFQIEVGNTASDYHAYNGTTTLINLGGTYYNGGKLTIDKYGHRKLTADGQTIDLTDGEPITASVGTNNIYADSGDCEVTYKKSIDDAISELQALILS